MDFDFTPDEQAFRAEVRAFLADNLPPREERGRGFMGEWLQKVRDKRWVGFSWPKEVGGGGGSLAEQAILKEEMALARAPALGTSFMGLAWVGPGIIQYGTEEQQQRFIPDILDSKVNWCTGYSEPNHGSDLAAIQTKAERVGGHYVVNGQKIWTTGAPWAHWIILLTRTRFEVAVKHDGITCLLVPMDSPGIDVRPIENMAGDRNFAEVFFTDVQVPVEHRLGEEGKGWAVTISAFANERSSIGEVTQMFAKLDSLKNLVRSTSRQGKPAADDPAVRRRIGEFDVKIAAMKYNGLRYLTNHQAPSSCAVNHCPANLRQQAAPGQSRNRDGRLRRRIDGARRRATTRQRRSGGRRALGAFLARLAERRDRRRHAEHSAQHHRRADSRVAEGLVVEHTCNDVSARSQTSRCAASPRRHIGHTSRGDNKAGGPRFQRALWARPSGGRRCAPRRVAPARRTPVRLRDRALRGTHRRPLTRHYKCVRPLATRTFARC